MGTCIGRRNYRSFTLFLYILSLLVLFVVGTSLYSLVQVGQHFADRDGTSLARGVGSALARNPLSLLIAIFALCAAVLVGWLTGFHVNLSIKGTQSELAIACFNSVLSMF